MLITRDDIQCVGDEETLLHFLEEKLDLPIPEKATLAQIALPLPLPFLGLDRSISEHIIDCQDFRGFSQDTLGDRRPFLIRFRRESDFSDVLRKVAKGLSQQDINPDKIFFICGDEYFKPFAFAYFGDSDTEDWYAEVLNILTWTQGNTRINTSFEHDLSAILSAEKSSKKSNDNPETENGFSNNRGESNLSENLLIKLQNIGTPLGVLIRPGDIHTGITPGYMRAFEIDEFTCKQLRSDDPKSDELIKPFLKPRKWMGESAHVICIPSSKNKSRKNKRWPWTGRNESEAERIFETTYPAISDHMKYHKEGLKKRICFDDSALFYWEFPVYGFYADLKRPKIFYSPAASSMHASYDTTEKLLFSAAFFPAEDLSLLAILNSKLFAWYAHQECWEPKPKKLGLNKSKMKKAPIAQRTDELKAVLSNLVQQILDTPDSLKVPDIEQEIDALVYDLYELTTAEIALIEEETNQ